MFSLLPDSTASNSRHLSNGIFQASRLEISNFICYLLVCIIEQMGLLVFYFCICVRFKCALNFIAYYYFQFHFSGDTDILVYHEGKREWELNGMFRFICNFFYMLNWMLQFGQFGRRQKRINHSVQMKSKPHIVIVYLVKSSINEVTWARVD